MRLGSLGLSPGGIWVPSSASAVAWTPALVTGGSLWLRADMGVTEATGVSAWSDSLGIQPDFVETTGSKQPVLGTDTIGGMSREVISSTAAAQQLLTCSAFVPPVTDAELVVVMKITGSPVVGYWGRCGMLDVYYPFTSGTIYESWGSTTRKNNITPPASINAWHVLSIRSNATSWKMYINGTLATSVTGNTLSLETTFVLFRALAGYGTTSMADLFAGREMSTGDRALFRTYLTAYYGLALDVDWV